MRLVGDAEGIAALRKMVDSNREYLKFLLAEAGSSIDHTAKFRDPDGVRWQLVHNLVSGEIEVRRAAP
ncbi:MAG TPA: hypothetical protein VK698_33235 [Kofleriaceae bacterium]|nr:hypothetical protein [Kofleriaceae bacterium]